MDNKINLESFPSDRVEALAMLYLYKRDTRGMSPEDLTKEYLRAYQEIKDTFKSERHKA
ncbi:MAG: hypothetical protein K2J11_00120 [Oscillospiraceae bacterium]|nr:hypothetical protein [Oscillospiraceae bacterium]